MRAGRSAHAAGAALVAIPNRGYPPEPEELELADVVLDSLAELDAGVVVELDRRREHGAAKVS